MEPAEQSASELSSTNNVHRAIAYARQLVGTPYGWWTGGGIPAGEPMFATNAPAPTTSSVASVNCTGLTNLMLRSVGKPIPGEGGTGAYGDFYWYSSETFDPNKTYPVGTLSVVTIATSTTKVTSPS